MLGICTTDVRAEDFVDESVFSFDDIELSASVISRDSFESVPLSDRDIYEFDLSGFPADVSTPALYSVSLSFDYSASYSESGLAVELVYNSLTGKWQEAEHTEEKCTRLVYTDSSGEHVAGEFSVDDSGKHFDIEISVAGSLYDMYFENVISGSYKSSFGMGKASYASVVSGLECKASMRRTWEDFNYYLLRSVDNVNKWSGSCSPSDFIAPIVSNSSDTGLETDTVVESFTLTDTVSFSGVDLDFEKEYYFNILITGSASGTKYKYISDAEYLCEPFVIYNGVKHYKSGVTCNFISAGVNDDIIVGVDVTVFVDKYYNMSKDIYVDNYIQFRYAFSNFDWTITELTELDSMSMGDQVINSSIQQGNELQEKNNELQEEANETSKNIFGSISDFFGSFFDNLVHIVVPEDGYFEDFFSRLNDFFSEKLGMLYAPIDMLVELLETVGNSSGSSGIVFPQLEFNGYVIIEKQTIDLQTIADNFDGLQDALYFGTDVLMVGSVLVLLQNKLKEVLGT